MTYDVVVTLGPATEAEGTLAGLAQAGATGFRLNTSHLSLESLQRWHGALAQAFGDPLPVPLVLDLQGSKWRLGEFPSFVLREAEAVELVYGPTAARRQVLPVPHADFFLAAASSNREIVLNDAKSTLRIEAAGQESIRAIVVQGGEIASNKGITFRRSDFRKASLSEKDAHMLETARQNPRVRYALSYVKDAAEMATYRRLLGPSAYLIAKLERATALDDAEAIAAAADELWLCRGDLGAEMGPRAMPGAVHRFSQKIAALSVPVFLAGQVLEHMTENPFPTRSELCYLYDALQAGYRGVVLSDETAVGRYPIQACRAAALFRGERT